METWNKHSKREEQPHKTDFYFGVVGDENHGHLVASGSIITGDIYFFRNAEGEIIINKAEDGQSLI